MPVSYNAFSVDCTLWCNVGELFTWLGREEILQGPTGGHCILGAMQLALEKDYGIKVHVDDMKTAIMKEVEKNADFYKQFHYDSLHRVITSAFEYLKYCTFTANVVDLVIPCAADALGVNFFLYTRNGVKTNILPYLCRKGSDIVIYLKYDRHGGSNHGTDHYNPIVLLPGTYKNVAQSTSLITVMTTDTINQSTGGCHMATCTPVLSGNLTLSGFVEACKEQLECEKESSNEENMWALPTSFASLFPPLNPLRSADNIPSLIHQNSPSLILLVLLLKKCFLPLALILLTLL